VEAEQTLKSILDEQTREGILYERTEREWVQCFACGHRCKIAPGRDGICKVRFNRDGMLFVPWGYVSGVQLDPVEKKPFFHAYPGSNALSFGMLGCDYHCPYCQNWITSQAVRDPKAITKPELISPERFVEIALSSGSKIVTSTYNEPLITSEWAMEIFKLAKQAGLVTSYVSNGNGTKEVLDYIQPYVDLYKVDLKGFSQKEYSKLGGTLQNVLDTIQSIHARGIWMEVVTLVIPGFNDSSEELTEIAKFLAGISPDIPWHVTAFHKEYKMTEPDNTNVKTLIRAAKIGYSAGLRYVYAGNIPGSVGRYENTYCHSCRKLLVERFGFRIMKNRIQNGACPSCKAKIPGRWA